MIFLKKSLRDAQVAEKAFLQSGGRSALLLFGCEVLVEGDDELVGVYAVHLAGLRDGFRGGDGAVEAVHAVGEEDRGDFRIHAHDFGDGRIGGDHGASFFLCR